MNIPALAFMDNRKKKYFLSAIASESRILDTRFFVLVLSETQITEDSPKPHVRLLFKNQSAFN